MKLEEKRIKIYDFQKYSKNPFTEKFVKKLEIDKRTRATKFARKTGTLINEDGEVLSKGSLLIGSERIVDKEQFVKIYVGTLMIFNDLSKQAALLFIIILRLLQKNSTKIFLVPKELIDRMGVSNSTYYRALVELLNSDMLARSDSSSIIYFINPAFLFNGDRMTIVNTFVKDDKTAEPSNSVEDIDKKDFLKLPNEDFYNDKPERIGGEVIDLENTDNPLPAKLGGPLFDETVED